MSVILDGLRTVKKNDKTIADALENMSLNEVPFEALPALSQEEYIEDLLDDVYTIEAAPEVHTFAL